MILNLILLLCEKWKRNWKYFYSLNLEIYIFSIFIISNLKVEKERLLNTF